MTEKPDSDRLVETAVESLQKLGLKEYESKIFVALCRVPTSTAKEVSSISNVPRTRVYDAIRVLESQGLVEVEHSNPKKFRAVPVEDALDVLRNRYDQRITNLKSALNEVDKVPSTAEEPVQEVWSLVGRTTISSRAAQLVESASDEVLLVPASEAVVDERMLRSICGVAEDVEVQVGVVDDSIRSLLEAEVPSNVDFVTGLDWLAEGDEGHGASLGRALLVDRESVLVSCLLPDLAEERAVVGRGSGNSLVVVARRLLSRGLLPPARQESRSL